MRQTSGGELRLGAAAAELVRREIRRAHGNEVCFLADVGDDGELTSPRVVARGHASAVLAAVRDPEPGGILLHNHPSGWLEPSEADLEVAARLWEQGLGFAICDNDATDLYVVVEPPAPERLDPLDLDALDGLLGAEGPIARAHPGYEDRPQQRALSRMIGALYNEGGVGIAEAGTGTGKSVAYLLPAIQWALQNRERTVVSTNTINLQEQLVEKDLPFLRRALGQPFRFALVKGRSNYISIRRAKLAWESAPSLLDDEKQAELKGIVEWMEATQDGSLSDLPFRPSPEVWEEVASESDVCLRAKCPHFEECFYQRARRDAASAEILVANHHLLFSDLAVRRAQGNYTAPAVLPQYRRLILDEAHNLEEAATRHMGATISRKTLFRVLRRLENRGKGVLPTLRKAIESGRRDLLAQAAVDLIEEKLQPALDGARERAVAVFALLEDVLRQQGDGMLRMEPSFAADPVWELGLGEELSGLLSHLETLLKGIETLRERISVDEQARQAHEQQLLELRGVGNRLESAELALRTSLRPGGDALEMVRWMELRRDPKGGEPNITLAAAPLDLSSVLKESVLDKVPTVVLTSATLATRNDFRFLRGRLGLTDDDAVSEAIFPSPFEYGEQSLLLIPEDLPVPSGEGDRRHNEATTRATVEHAKVTDGGLFVLFTSYRALREVAGGLRQRGADRVWPLFVQGEAPRAQLVKRFIESGRGILLGTTSFWEGVDVPGRPLRGLIIPKLPFKVPTEPVTAARIEAIEARGGNSFTSYMLPHAAIRLKQGFGRLIRSRTDHGAVLILDPRLVRKSYGRYLLESLPPAPVVAGPWREAHEAMRRFYGATAVRLAG
ncbi:MAG TPA: helicase C-terminal domain-containing protein [Longimicrobiaceae bacterium]|nr:helicase C-terminal domain-containing protein [Longimicrobiaceae bacterium]